MCLEDYYKKGKVHHLLITEADQATGLYSIVWCTEGQVMAEWCNVHIAKNGNIYPIFKHFTNATIVMITPQ